jgi:hypothetical protein
MEGELLTADECRLLVLLGGSADGCTDALLTAQGFKLDVLISVVSAGFATATPERAFAAGKPVEVTRVRITEAGRQVLGSSEQRRFQAVGIGDNPKTARLFGVQRLFGLIAGKLID